MVSSSRSCLKLRFEVFHREYMNKKRTVGVDIDKLDYICDHLVIKDKRTDRVIGTYRLNSSKFTNTFYSASEFNMSKLLELEGNKLELVARALIKIIATVSSLRCLARIAAYLQLTDTKHMFGCGSIKTMDPLQTGSQPSNMIDEGVLTRSTACRRPRSTPLNSSLKCLSTSSRILTFMTRPNRKAYPDVVSVYIKMAPKCCAIRD